MRFYFYTPILQDRQGGVMFTIEDLGVNNFKIYQDDKLYKFTSDSVLLAKFARAKKGDVVADFCSGSGIVGLYFLGLNFPLINSLTLFEKQTPLYEMSKESIALNGLDKKVSAVNIPLQDLGSSRAGEFSLILCNPPYMPVGSGFLDKDEHVAICRTEIALSLNQLIESIAVSLKFGGRVCMVHRADRLVDVITQMKNKNIEPKRLQFVTGGKKEPYLFLIEGVKGGKSGLTVHNTVEN